MFTANKLCTEKMLVKGTVTGDILRNSLAAAVKRLIRHCPVRHIKGFATNGKGIISFILRLSRIHGNTVYSALLNDTIQHFLYSEQGQGLFSV